MELNVCWMYHDIMDLYGDKGNMMVLQKRCEERGISITIDTPVHWRSKGPSRV